MFHLIRLLVITDRIQLAEENALDVIKREEDEENFIIMILMEWKAFRTVYLLIV